MNQEKFCWSHQYNLVTLQYIEPIIILTIPTDADYLKPIRHAATTHDQWNNLLLKLKQNTTFTGFPTKDILLHN